MDEIETIVGRSHLFGCAVFGIAAILLVGCAPDDGGPLADEQSSARGEQVFEFNCGFCHGADGRGPSLAEIRSLSDSERRGKIINHPVSGQIPQRLPANEISDLMDFFAVE